MVYQKNTSLKFYPLKKANVESIYCALVEYYSKKNTQLGRLIGMGFDGAATFSGDKTGVQRRSKELSSHVLFVHCRCHVLQLASVQAGNATPGIKHVYTTLMMLWSSFLSFQNMQSLKEIQKVLYLPDLKILKPSHTCWLAHEHCVKAVKVSYSSIVLALENIYETSHEPEALGLSKALSSHSTIAAMYLLDNILPQVAKLSRALQTKHLDLSLIFSQVDATLQFT